jgi:hypothetical protein
LASSIELCCGSYGSEGYMSATERMSDISVAWNLALPQIPAPTEYWLAKLCVFPDSAVEHGLSRAGAKFRKICADPDRIARYVFSVTRNSFKDHKRDKLDEDPASRW